MRLEWYVTDAYAQVTDNLPAFEDMAMKLWAT
jgi:hypothetical protein